jgi:hypothetical protein
MAGVMKVLQASIGPPGHEGWLRAKKYREATLAEQTGWWVNYKQRIFLQLEPPPASLRGGFAVSLENRSVRPPGQEGRSPACDIFHSPSVPRDL